MNWRKFKQKFGVDTTKNYELIQYAKRLKLKPFRCVMRDEIKDLPKYGYFIVNIQLSSQTGAHWSAVYSNSKVVYFFDSYALPPTKYYPEILEKFNHTSKRYCPDWHEQIQTFDKKYCGQMALYFLYKMSKSKKKSLQDYFDILESIKIEEKNE